MAKLRNMVLAGALVILPVKNYDTCSNESARKDIYNIEQYLSESKEKDPIFHYKITLFDYIDALKEIGEIEKIKLCKTEIKKDYAKIMGSINNLIAKSENPSELISFKNNLKKKFISETDF